MKLTGSGDKRKEFVPMPKNEVGLKGLMWCCYSKQRDEDDTKDVHVLPQTDSKIGCASEPEAHALPKEVRQQRVLADERCMDAAASSIPKLPQVEGAESQAQSSSPSHLLTQAPDDGATSTKQVQPLPRAAAMEPLLPPKEAKFQDRKTLVLDLDETLVHSSFTEVPCDLVLSVTLAGEQHKIYVRKRPGLDDFMAQVSKLFEVAVFTASTALYANTLLDVLDTKGWIQHRLFREACTRYREGYVKDLSRLGRPLNHVIIIDNMPICYALQPHNAIPIQTWKHDPADTELVALLPILVSLARVDNIPRMLQSILSDEDLDDGL